MNKCPDCGMEVTDIIDHFKFVHRCSPEETARKLFSEIRRLDSRIDTLYELLEIKEK